jgi:hypothetical protein
VQTTQFEQLLIPNAYNLYYLPIPDPIMAHFLDDDEEKIFVGSAIELHEELQILLKLGRELIAQNGADTLFPYTDGGSHKYTWHDVYDVGEMLLQATIESQNLNLPIYLCM